MFSQILPHHAPDGFGGLDLHGVGGVRVGAQSEARIGMTQHTGDSADVHAALQGSGSEGVPGGAAMATTIPADIVQYYGYTLRAIQKLLYLYGFPEIDTDEEGIFLDSETINRIIICLGVMNGVAGANNAIKALAQALAKGVEKKLLSAALTKGTFYPILKSTLKWFGVKLTKEIFAKSVKNVIPVVGGVVGGGITFLSFKPCCLRLKAALTDTMLSNPNHVSSTEEEHIYSHIIDGTVYEAEYEDCAEEHSIEIETE